MKDLLQRATHEIEQLRRENEILRAKVEVMDLFALVLRTQPAYLSVGMSEDVAWALRKEIHRIESEESTDAHQGHSGRRAEEDRLDRNGRAG